MTSEDPNPAFSHDLTRCFCHDRLSDGDDKGKLKFVIPFCIPALHGLYQDIGRCRGDGLKAQGILLMIELTKKFQEYFIRFALPF